MKLFLIAQIALVAGIVSAGSLPTYIDCDAETAISTQSRSCCYSNQLPNGCECFDISKDSDFTNTFGMFKPQCPEEMGIYFYLFTKEDPDNFFNVTLDNVAESGFDASKETKFIVHGWGDYPFEESYVRMREAVVAYGDYNVIMVDWDDAAGRFDRDFFKSVADCRSVGAITANFILNLKDNHQTSLSDVHLICSHLGVQVCAYAGKEVFRVSGEKIARITGNDAVATGFEGFASTVRLDKTDAEFVDLTHTDAGPNGTFGLGMTMSVAHVDFRPNGGAFQAGCPIVNVTYMDIITQKPGSMLATCSHYRANDLFINSIDTCEYRDPNNQDCRMGFHATPVCSGDVIIDTAPTAPFCEV